MYKMLIVDDEFHTREGLKKLLGWSDLGIEIVGVCSDGQEGVEQAFLLKPDIILTDIKMNSMDGLAMADKIKEKLDCEFIIISGYTLFEYAHKAMSTGIAHYLVKPISRTALEETIIKVIATLNKKKHRDILNNLEDREYILDFLINGNDKTDCKGYIDFDKFRVIIVKSENTIARSRDDKMRIFSELIFLMGGIYIYFINNQSFVIVTALEDIDFDKLKDIIKIPCKIGMSEYSTGDTSFREIYEHANISLQYLVYNSNEDNYIEYNDHMEKRADAFFSDALKHILNSLESGEIDEAKDEIEDAFAKARNEKVIPSDVIEWAKHLFWFIIKIVKPKTDNDKDIEIYTERMDYCVKDKLRFDDLKNLLKEICDTCSISGTKPEIHMNSGVIDDIVAYVNDHYQEDVSLQKLSNMFFVEFTYLSKLFKAHTGECYIQYLTRKRMEKAKELLLDFRLTIYEVAYMVSFEDSKYFSNLFKKTEGMTPREFRLKHKGR